MVELADGERAPTARQFDQKYGRADAARTILRLVPQREVDGRPPGRHVPTVADPPTGCPATSRLSAADAGYALAFRRFAHG